jgi:ferredoxin
LYSDYSRGRITATRILSDSANPGSKSMKNSSQSSILDRLIAPSTRAFVKEARRTAGYSYYDWLHGYVYARWPYLYIGIGTGEHPAARRFGPLVSAFQRTLRRNQPGSASSNQRTNGSSRLDPDASTHTFADGYHGKVVPLKAAAQLVTVNEPIRLPELEQVIPYVRARDIILQNPDHIIALECPCRSNRENPCLPLDVCLIVGEPFASFVAEHHPQRARWISPSEAVNILQAEDERGHVHHAFFKDAMLGRFYAICNCCACCCGAMQAQQRGTPMLASSGYVNQVDEALCIGCGDCIETCQFGALSVEEVFAVVDDQLCMGCGICVSHCDQGALTLIQDPSKGQPLELLQLIENFPGQ